MLDELEFRESRLGWGGVAMVAGICVAGYAIVALFGTAGAAVIGALTVGYLAAKVA